MNSQLPEAYQAPSVVRYGTISQITAGVDCGTQPDGELTVDGQGRDALLCVSE